MDLGFRVFISGEFKGFLRSGIGYTGSTGTGFRPRLPKIQDPALGRATYDKV